MPILQPKKLKFELVEGMKEFKKNAYGAIIAI